MMPLEAIYIQLQNVKVQVYEGPVAKSLRNLEPPGLSLHQAPLRRVNDVIQCRRVKIHPWTDVQYSEIFQIDLVDFSSSYVCFPLTQSTGHCPLMQLIPVTTRENVLSTNKGYIHYAFSEHQQYVCIHAGVRACMRNTQSDDSIRRTTQSPCVLAMLNSLREVVNSTPQDSIFFQILLYFS